MRISVALCSYNGATYIREQLRSIAAQSRLPDELVICDDGSSDDTVAEVRSFSRTVTFPVRLTENNTRLGVTSNFSQAIDLCIHEIIVLADQDDVWEVDKLRIIEEGFIADPQIGAIFSNANLINERGENLPGSLWGKVGFRTFQQRALESGDGLECLLKGNFVTGAVLAFRATLKKVLLPIPVEWVHDYWIAVMAATVSKLGYNKEILISYRCHAAQQIGVSRPLSRKLRKAITFNAAVYLAAEKLWTEAAMRLKKNHDRRHEPAIAIFEEIALHMRQRGQLPDQRWKRLPIVVREIMDGKYQRYSMGMRSVMHDILAACPDARIQPANNRANDNLY